MYTFYSNSASSLVSMWINYIIKKKKSRNGSPLQMKPKLFTICPAQMVGGAGGLFPAELRSVLTMTPT